MVSINTLIFDNSAKFDCFSNKIYYYFFIGCITTVVAYDPDIEDRNADQHIFYFIALENQQPFIVIDKSGCMKLKKPLDRDPPNGYSVWTVS